MFNKCELNMKKFLLRISLIFIVIFTSSVFAKSQVTYLGLDLISGKNGYKNKFGAELLNDTCTSGINIFVGHYFSKWLGLEIGSQHFLTKFKEAEALFDTVQFGIDRFSGFSDDRYNSKISMHGVNINLAPKFILNQYVSMVPFVGVAYIRTKIAVDIVSRDGELATTGDKTMLNFNCAKSKIIPRIGIRGEYLFTNNFGFRISYVWENTSAIKLTTVRETIVPRRTVIAKLKNTSTYSIGIFYHLMG